MVLEATGTRIALRPSARGILRGEDEADRAVERRPVSRIALLEIEPQQQPRAFDRGVIVKGGVPVIMPEFLEAPAVAADRRVPAPERFLSGEVDDVVPAAARMLAADQRVRGLLRGAIIELLAGPVVGIEEDLAHLRRARRLRPDHRRKGFHLTPAARQIGQVGPDIAAFNRDLFGHEARRAPHRVPDGLGLRFGAGCRRRLQKRHRGGSGQQAAAVDHQRSDSINRARSIPESEAAPRRPAGAPPIQRSMQPGRTAPGLRVDEARRSGTSTKHTARVSPGQRWNPLEALQRAKARTALRCGSLRLQYRPR